MITEMRKRIALEKDQDAHQSMQDAYSDVINKEDTEDDTLSIDETDEKVKENSFSSEKLTLRDDITNKLVHQSSSPSTSFHTLNSSISGDGSGKSSLFETLSSATNSRRQAHIASEQKRRQSINEGFEDLRRAIPSCAKGSDSKAVILRKAVTYILSLQAELGRRQDIINNEGEREDELDPQQSDYFVTEYHGRKQPSSAISTGYTTNGSTFNHAPLPISRTNLYARDYSHQGPTPYHPISPSLPISHPSHPINFHNNHRHHHQHRPLSMLSQHTPPSAHQPHYSPQSQTNYYGPKRGYPSTFSPRVPPTPQDQVFYEASAHHSPQPSPSQLPKPTQIANNAPIVTLPRFKQLEHNYDNYAYAASLSMLRHEVESNPTVNNNIIDSDC